METVRTYGTSMILVDSTYFIKSEDKNIKGYVGIMLKRKIQFRDITKFQWLIELKYIKEIINHCGRKKRHLYCKFNTKT